MLVKPNEPLMIPLGPAIISSMLPTITGLSNADRHSFVISKFWELPL